MKTILKIIVLFLATKTSAQYTAIPDEGFEQLLIGYGYDVGPRDHKVLTANINTVIDLWVYDGAIWDLTGIQDFVALKSLDCRSLQITSLNVSGLTALEDLRCQNSQLTSLNVSGCKALRILDCHGNKLSSLNLSGLNALMSIQCRDNQLSSLNVSGFTDLLWLHCLENQLTSLNVSGATSLNELYCSHNQLTSLNVSGLTALTILHCYNNQLTSLNLSGTKSLSATHCNLNPSLSCIQVDDIAETSTQYWSKDATANFSLNCALGTSSHKFINSVVVFPNPIQTILNLSTTITIEKIVITDLAGKMILQQNQNIKQVNVQNLAKGLYILQAFSGKEKFTSKFVKK